MNTVAITTRKIALFCLLYAITIAAQSITGTVVDDPFPLKRANMPVENAVVYLSQYNPDQKGRFETVEQIIAAGLLDSTITSQQGIYLFDNLSPKTYIVSIKHPDYRSSPQMVYVAKDTTANFMLISANVAVEVVGHVQLKKADGAGFTPVPACTVSVRKSLIKPHFTLDDLVPPKPAIKVVTNNEGYFTVTDIPITANGETWVATASFMGSSQSTSFDCYNLLTDTADIIFSESYANSASTTFDGATFTLSANKDAYHWSESIEVRYSITNPTATAITFDSFAEGCEYDFIVTLDNGREVYRESVTRICVAMMGAVTVKPGEMVTHTFSPFNISSNLSEIRKDTLNAPNELRVSLQARVMGAKYNSTQLEVPVTIYLDPPVRTVSPLRKPNNVAVSYNSAQQRLIFNSTQPQNIAVQIYSLNGAVLPHRSLQQQLSAGMQTISLQGMLRNRVLGSECYIIEVKGVTFWKRFFTVNLTK